MHFNIRQWLCVALSLCILTLAISSVITPRPVTVEPQHGDVGSVEENGYLNHLRPAMMSSHQGTPSTANPQLTPSHALYTTNASAMGAPRDKTTVSAFESKVPTVTKYLASTVTLLGNETKTESETRTRTRTVTLRKTVYQRITRTKLIAVSDGVAVATKYSPAMGGAMLSYGTGLRMFSAVAGVVVAVVMFLFF